MNRLRVGVVGCGDIAQNGHLPALVRRPDVELVGVVDRLMDRAAAVAQHFGTRVLPDLPAVVTAGAQALVIATPPEVTPDLTLDAIALGVDVLCEKPMAVDLERAITVDAAAEQSRCVVQVGFKNRFSPLIRAVRRWVLEGRLGAPVAYTLAGYDECLDPRDATHLARILHFLEHGPSFVHDGAHFADHLAFLTGSQPVSVQALGLRSRADFPSENFTSALVRYDNGDVARLEIGWLFPVSPAGDFRALGPQGVALVDRPGGVATLDSGTGRCVVRLDRPWNDVCFDRQLSHFVMCVQDRSTPETSTAAGVASLRLGTRVVEAMRTGRTVSW